MLILSSYTYPYQTLQMHLAETLQMLYLISFYNMLASSFKEDVEAGCRSMHKHDINEND